MFEPPAQEIRPQELAEGRRVLGETAGAAQLAGETAKRIIDQVPDAPRNIGIAAAATLGIEGMQPAPVVQVDPERLARQPPQIRHHGHGDLLDPLLVQRQRQVMVVGDVAPAAGAEHHRDHVRGQRGVLVGFRAPRLPLALDLAQPHRHLRRPQFQDRHRMDDGIAARIKHVQSPLGALLVAKAS